LEKTGVAGSSQKLPQLYRFCFLMTGDAGKAQEIFQACVREAARRSARHEVPQDPLWLFREARWRCVTSSQEGLQAEPATIEENEVSANAADQIAQLDPAQLAAWIAGAPEPQRSALAFYYLDEFTYDEILSLLGVKVRELGELLSNGRRQFQAWLNTMTRPVES
jgi:DNA-directed RNA polymerase specialized sigma24 family protein